MFNTLILCFTFRFDKLGNVNHSKQRSVNVVLPVEISAEPPTTDSQMGDMWAESRDDSPAVATVPTTSYIPDYEVLFCGGCCPVAPLLICSRLVLYRILSPQMKRR